MNRKDATSEPSGQGRPAAALPLKFDTSGGFDREIRQRVDRYFDNTGLRRIGNAAESVKAGTGQMAHPRFPRRCFPQPLSVTVESHRGVSGRLVGPAAFKAVESRLTSGLVGSIPIHSRSTQFAAVRTISD